MGTLPRFIISGFFAALIAISLYLIMQSMIGKDSDIDKNRGDLPSIDFSKVKLEEDAKMQSRRIPKRPPPPKEPPQKPKMDINQDQQVSTPAPTMNMPNLDVAAGGTGPFLGTVGSVNMNEEGGVIPIVRIAPQYPRKALMAKIEGWVKVRFTITPGGTVTNPQVVDAKPKRMFDRAALNAIRKFKFKPKVVNGQQVEQVATQTIEFELPDN